MTNPPPPSPGDDPVADLTALLDRLAGEPAPADSAKSAPADAGDLEPVFGNVDAFVRGYLARMVERRLAEGPTAGVYWCPRWWAHPEALSRLYAVWRAWESLVWRAWESLRVSDPQTDMSIWWRDHLDPHLAALTGAYGPFGRCGPDKHTEPKTLPVQPAPIEVLAQLPDGGAVAAEGPPRRARYSASPHARPCWWTPFAGATRSR